MDENRGAPYVCPCRHQSGAPTCTSCGREMPAIQLRAELATSKVKIDELMSQVAGLEAARPQCVGHGDPIPMVWSCKECREHERETAAEDVVEAAELIHDAQAQVAVLTRERDEALRWLRCLRCVGCGTADACTPGCSLAAFLT